jgi:catechol 2,3-dioxygenase-like lactoylglutathione lyase family enzyme
MRLLRNQKEIVCMTQLNHINLGVSDVPELTHFFETGFGFRVTESRGQGKLPCCAARTALC